MARLSSAEKVELGAIPIAAFLVTWLAPRPGVTFALGEWIAGAALLVLLQGFFRDLWLLRQARLRASTATRRAARCMCVESALGLTGVVGGIGLVGFGLGHPVFISATGLTAAVAGVMLVGFLLKDFVFEWSPWKIYREKDHAQVTFRWRK